MTYSDTSSVTDMRYMFQYCSNLITIPQLDTSNVTDMHEMFHECRNLTTIPQLDTSNVTDMYGMFHECRNLTTIPQLNTRNATIMYQMFENCYKLATIDITHMNITDQFYGSRIAYNCFSLTKLIIRNMPTIPTINSNAFDNCYHFTGTTDATYNPQGLKDGRIYVPDDKVEALKTATNWSVYADIIVPLSTLVE
ncbi:MAG: BspA family leucine-rich repeat surface protein [Candidatus Onthovivens sp.]|nr:BspA family leucine-rich repeat surface protein [Candidatus Onthovivens sp.]